MSPRTRIAKISLSDYRAFPAGHACVFNLGADGKNLLLFGENGSGKTSLFRALRDLMAVNTGPADFALTRNVFTAGEEGAVSTDLTAGPQQDFTWKYGGQHPRETDGEPYRSFAQRFWFLDYKDILHTNYDHEGRDEINVFRLLVDSILDGVKLPDGKTVTEQWDAVLHYAPPPPDDEEGQASPDDAREHVIARAKKFVDELDGILNQRRIGIVAVANRFLKQMSPGLRLHLKVQRLKLIKLSTDPRAEPHQFREPCILLEATLAGHRVKHPAHFLNEARLTGIGIVLHLAAAKAAIPTGGAGSAPVLVLDDVLIGLDMANRLPVLRLLVKEFGDWQIILMTYDRVWFELAKEFTEHTGLWTTLNLRELPTVPGQPGKPHVESCPDLLAIADIHLKKGDKMATAVYVRAAFENHIKNVCKDCGVKINYKPDPKEVKANHLWQGIVDRQKERQTNGKPNFIDPALMNDVETVRSTVLNRLSHSGTPTLLEKEVRFAFDTVKKLQHHKFT